MISNAPWNSPWEKSSQTDVLLTSKSKFSVKLTVHLHLNVPPGFQHQNVLVTFNMLCSGRASGGGELRILLVIITKLSITNPITRAWNKNCFIIFIFIIYLECHLHPHILKAISLKRLWLSYKYLERAFSSSFNQILNQC